MGIARPGPAREGVPPCWPGTWGEGIPHLKKREQGGWGSPPSPQVPENVCFCIAPAGISRGIVVMCYFHSARTRTFKEVPVNRMEHKKEVKTHECAKNRVRYTRGGGTGICRIPLFRLA